MMQHFPGHEACAVAAQECDHRGDFAGLAQVFGGTHGQAPVLLGRAASRPAEFQTKKSPRWGVRA